MMTYCGADCGNCSFRDNCKGCKATCGSPFGGKCVAAEYLKQNNMIEYGHFKTNVLRRINSYLERFDITPAEALYELPGFYVNLEYEITPGVKARLLDDRNIYLGAQIVGEDRCYGIITDGDFLILCSYEENGANPYLISYVRIYDMKG